MVVKVNKQDLPVYAELWRQTLHWEPSAHQQTQFQQLYDQVLLGNQQINLTRITQPDEFWEKHFWDSLSGLIPWLVNDASSDQASLDLSHPVRQVIDIGTGPGFPGLPAAIVCPHWQITLLDSTRKKIAFLQDLCRQLSLANVSLVTDRAEAIGHNPRHREQYDLALLRAVGPVSACAEYALPLLKPGGLAVLYRGHWPEPGADTLDAALDQLSGRLEMILPWQTPLTQSVRHCLYVRKIAPSAPEFPRSVGVPAKQPL